MKDVMELAIARRRLLAAGCLGAVAIVAAGCGSAVGTGGAATPTRALADFHNAFLEFRYPASWAAAQPDVDGTLHFHPMLYLSEQPTRNPCQTTTDGTSCGWPIVRLRPGRVLIVWENRGSPGWSLRSTPGVPLSVGGRPARRHVSRPGPCAAIGADETIEVAIARPLADNWTALTACLRAPNLADSERAVDALLASTKFNAP